MKQKLILVLSIFTIFLCGCLFSKPQQICIKEVCLEVELAKTQEERDKGLMLREELAQNKGMLFIFEEETKAPMWMKNTLIPLDIIWISKNKEIISIKKNAQPCLEEKCSSFAPDGKAAYVLEVNGGTADKIRLKAGDEVEFSLNQSNDPLQP